MADLREYLPGLNADTVLWIIMIVVLLPFVVYAFPQLFGFEDALVVQSGSMEPAIPTASVILINDVQPENVEVNDIITFQSDTRPNGKPVYTTHRVIGINQNNGELVFETKGDNNEDPDPWTVSEDQIVGKHFFTIPEMGYLLVWLGTERAFLALVLIPAVVLIASEMLKIGRELWNMKRDGDDNQLMGTAALIFSFLIVMVAVAAYTDFLDKIITNIGLNISTNVLAALIFMGLMLISVVALRFV
jgi:signal peptidase